MYLTGVVWDLLNERHYKNRDHAPNSALSRDHHEIQALCRVIQIITVMLLEIPQLVGDPRTPLQRGSTPRAETGCHTHSLLHVNIAFQMSWLLQLFTRSQCPLARYPLQIFYPAFQSGLVNIHFWGSCLWLLQCSIVAFWHLFFLYTLVLII